MVGLSPFGFFEPSLKSACLSNIGYLNKFVSLFQEHPWEALNNVTLFYSGERKDLGETLK